ncbi:hypothetical protein RND71_009323 [Anisodus tanguticus]|uniref:Uncharacterized protein n=1 Tax=Anisodus tanguticus TaxID=243964 RepID=A0AAE1VH47_9SOLA|nr:hypothetical protein RND71_009323 [Anisodus tanguticus]
MDETGVHSLLNANRSIVPDKGTASPVQTVADKDLSNPLMAVTLPKSESEEDNSSKPRRRLPKTFTQGSSSRTRTSNSRKKKNKEIEKIDQETLAKILQNRQDPPNEGTEQEKHVNPTIPQSSQLPVHSQEHNSDNENEEHVSDSEFTDAQDLNEAQDPNDYDSGMSFDSIALHNLDT